MDHGGDIDVEEFTEFLNGDENDNSADEATIDSDDENTSYGSSQTSPTLSPKRSSANLKRTIEAQKKEKADIRQYTVGMDVEARYGGRKKWFKAVVVQVHAATKAKGKRKKARVLSAAQKKLLQR